MAEKNEQEKIMKDAQYRKGLSIAFFNATNAAVEMVKLENTVYPLIEVKATVVKLKGKTTAKAKKPAAVKKPESINDRIKYWRNWLLEEHKEYYATVIAPVGINFKPEDSIVKLKAAKTLPDLQSAWRLLSQDERNNEEVLKVAKELRKKYPND